MRNVTAPVRGDMADYRTAIIRRPIAARSVLLRYEDTIRRAYDAYTDDITAILSLEPIELEDNSHSALLLENYSALKIGRSLEELSSVIDEAANFRCPMCNFEPSGTTDHFLGKARFPEFSILSRNLVAACYTCNNGKGTHPVTDFVHAYFDCLPDEPFLLACTSWGPKLRVTYSLERPANISDDMFGRLTRQFEHLALSKRLAREASFVLAEVIGNCARDFARGGAALVRSELLRQGDVAGSSYGINHYKTALYKGLAIDHRFCAGGFRDDRPKVMNK
jgi:hypothetical protein